MAQASEENPQQIGIKALLHRQFHLQSQGWPLQQSEISAKIKEHQVVNCILDKPVTLNICEVLASSTHLSDQIMEMLKRKNPKPAHAAFYSLNFNDILDKESLIRL
jgi:hypothetical protein